MKLSEPEEKKLEEEMKELELFRSKLANWIPVLKALLAGSVMEPKVKDLKETLEDRSQNI